MRGFNMGNLNLHSNLYTNKIYFRTFVVSGVKKNNIIANLGLGYMVLEVFVRQKVDISSTECADDV